MYLLAQYEYLNNTIYLGDEHVFNEFNRVFTGISFIRFTLNVKRSFLSVVYTNILLCSTSIAEYFKTLYYA